MKRTLFIALTCLMTSSLFAQDNVVKLNPLGALFGSINAGFEHKLNDNHSAQLNVNFISRTVDVIFFKYKFSGFGVAPEYRFHLGDHENPFKLYAGPVVNVNFLTSKVDGEDVGSSKTTYTAIGGGGQIGYEWLIGSAFVIDVNAGAVYQSVSSSTEAESSDGETLDIDFNLAVSGIFPRITAAIGIAF